LIKVGGGFTPGQSARARELGVDDAIRVLPFLTDRRTLASLYRRAALVLQPSEAEGFGLPLAEAMACGAPLLVSDIPVLREVAGEAAVYRPVGDVAAWAGAALAMLADRAGRSDAWRSRRDAGLARSALFGWDAHVARLVAIYRGLAEASGPA
jgi:glycosyltransferase involved in cell wall biosynthesis